MYASMLLWSGIGSFKETIEPLSRKFRNAREIVVEVNVVESKSIFEAQTPFEIVECRPIEVPFHIHSIPTTCPRLKIKFKFLWEKTS